MSYETPSDDLERVLSNEELHSRFAAMGDDYDSFLEDATPAKYKGSITERMMRHLEVSRRKISDDVDALLEKLHSRK